jgi:outer membrane lipoprotein
MRTPAICVLALLSLGGCQSAVPLEIRSEPALSLSLADVQADPAAREGWLVRWGGAIVKVENRNTETWFEVLGTTLDGEGRPKDLDNPTGRFLARVHGFLDPAVYRPDRKLTVYGTVAGSESRPIGDRPYIYPLIKTQTYYLWPEYVVDDAYARSYWYDPYYYPYYYPFPYWHRSPFGLRSVW